MQNLTTTTLKKNKLKATPLRIALLQHILESDLPVAVQSCMEHLESQKVIFDKVTIYRNLETFVQKGIIKKIDLHDGKYYYEKDVECSHLICQKCGLVEHLHLPKEQAFATLEAVTKKTGFVVQQEVRDFFGTCKDCQ